MLGRRRLRSGAALAATAIALLTVSGCSSSTPTPASTGNPSGGTSISNLDSDIAAPTVATDTKATLAPAFFSDADNPCAGTATTSLMGEVAPPCAAQWIPLEATSVPGQDVIDSVPTPKSASLARGIDAAPGTADATAFYTTLALQLWALGGNSATIIGALDGPSRGNDPVYSAVSGAAPARIDVPVCAYPTSLRVAVADSGVIGHMSDLGWPSPSSTAVVATYAACAGVSLQGKDGKSHTILSHKAAVSIVTTGHVATVSPFGSVWITDGWAPCQAGAGMASLCGA